MLESKHKLTSGTSFVKSKDTDNTNVETEEKKKEKKPPQTHQRLSSAMGSILDSHDDEAKVPSEKVTETK